MYIDAQGYSEFLCLWETEAVRQTSLVAICFPYHVSCPKKKIVQDLRVPFLPHAEASPGLLLCLLPP